MTWAIARTRKALIVGGLCIAGTLTAVAPADVEYELVIIEPWNTTYSLASSKVAGLNNNNVVTGCASPISGGCSFIWTLEGGKQSINIGGVINDNGVIVSGSTLRQPDGTLVTLQDEAGYLVSGQDLNNSNVVAGSWGSSVCESQSEAATWDEQNGITLFFQELGIFAADLLRSVNENNIVVGMKSVTGQCGDFEAFVYDLTTGEFTDLHAQLVGAASGITEMFDINDSNIALGQGPHDGTTRPFLWSEADGFVFLPALPGALLMQTHLESLNNHNTAVGWAIIQGTGTRGIIWDEVNGTRDLNDLVETPDNFAIDQAKKINDNGWITGTGHYGTWSPSRAVVLIPIEDDEPVVGDLNSDGGIDVFDLLMLLKAWGTPHADMTGDNMTDVADLLMLLDHWPA